MTVGHRPPLSHALGIAVLAATTMLAQVACGVNQTQCTSTSEGCACTVGQPKEGNSCSVSASTQYNYYGGGSDSSATYCCADATWALSGTCACYYFGCQENEGFGATDSSASCTCGPLAKLSYASHLYSACYGSLSTAGVCCLDATNNECTCEPSTTRKACDTGTTLVDNCTVKQLTFACPKTQTPVISCTE